MYSEEAFCWLILVMLTVMGCGKSPPKPIAPPRQNLDEIYRALDEAPELYLYSLSPDEQKDDGDEDHQFHRWPHFGRTQVEGQSRKDLVKAFRDATELKVGMAMCFEPHHGIRAEFEDRKIDVVVCFACQTIEVFSAGKKAGYSIDGSGLAVFNRILKDAKLPFPEERVR